MGQHKFNLKSQLKKEGAIPPKPTPMGAPESRRRLQELVDMKLTEFMLARGTGKNQYAMYPRHFGETEAKKQLVELIVKTTFEGEGVLYGKATANFEEEKDKTIVTYDEADR